MLNFFAYFVLIPVHRGMLERGVYLAPSQYEAGFTSLAHTDADIDFTIAAATAVLKSL